MVKLFVDTDIGPDCDDAGALAVIHALCAQGKAELLGVTCCAGNPYGIQAVSAINRFYGREVPLGTSTRADFLSDAASVRYVSVLADRFDHEFRSGRKPCGARETFRRVLEAQEDGSVTVLSIGPLNNLADFLSDASCRALIEKKVKRLVSMAGRFDCAEPEWNVKMDVAAMKAVIDSWPTECVLCGWECGRGILTGAPLEGRSDPVAEAYRIYTRGTMRRDSYDLVTALYAVLGDCGWIRAGEKGVVTVSDDGATAFSPDPDGRRRYTMNLVENDKLAGVLNALL